MNDASPQLDFSIVDMPNHRALQLSGSLTRTTMAALTQAFQAIFATKKSSPVRVCTQKISQWDAAGLIHLKICMKETQQKKIRCELEPLSKNLQSLWALISDPTLHEHVLPEKTDFKGVEKIGATIVQWGKTFKQSLDYTGQVISCLISLVKRPKELDWRKVFFYIQDIGPNSLPLTLLIGMLFGLIMAFQSAGLLKSFGAEIYVANLVSVALVKELGPLLMAIILTGRIASAYAAEIGAMQANQEIDALTVMGLPPIPFLVLPRLVATAMIAPFIALFMDFFGMLGCMIMMLCEGFTRQVIIEQMFTFLSFSDFVSSFIKSIVFGFLIAGIGCFHGLNSERNAAAVGASTTQTMVSCIAIITSVDGIFTTILFYLGT